MLQKLNILFRKSKLIDSEQDILSKVETSSDVDFLIDTTVTSLSYLVLMEELREKLFNITEQFCY